MFFSKVVALVALAAVSVSVSAAPLPLPLQKAAVARQGEQTQAELNLPILPVHKRDTERVVRRGVSVQQAAMSSSDGSVIPYENNGVGKRNAVVAEEPLKAKRSVSVQNAAMSGAGGEVVPYSNDGKSKRSADVEEELEAIIPRSEEKAELPKREVNHFPTSVAARSVDGVIMPFNEA